MSLRDLSPGAAAALLRPVRSSCSRGPALQVQTSPAPAPVKPEALGYAPHPMDRFILIGAGGADTIVLIEVEDDGRTTGIELRVPLRKWGKRWLTLFRNTMALTHAADLHLVR